MSNASSSYVEGIEQALERNDARGAATAAQDGLRAIDYDKRKAFLVQVCATLVRRAETPDGATVVAEAGELMWMMPEFRSNTSVGASVSGETLLLAAALGTANMTLADYAKVLAFDRELLQSPAFFSYDAFTAVDRLACVARVLRASRETDSTRYVDSAVQKGMSLFHGLMKERSSPDVDAQNLRDAVVRAYLFELGCHRQSQCDYLRAFQSFFSLFESSRQEEALCRAALNALCIRASDGARSAALHDVLQCSTTTTTTVPSLRAFVSQAYHQQLFHAVDVANVLAATGELMPKAVVRDALREHNILLLAQSFDCVYWRSLCVHMDDAEITEGELYDLLVEMVRAKRIVVSIHQDSGFIEFGHGDAAAGRHVITDADVFNRIAQVTAAIAAAHPELLRESSAVCSPRRGALPTALEGLFDVF